MNGEKGPKRKGTGRRGPYKKFYVQEKHAVQIPCKGMKTWLCLMSPIQELMPP